MRKCNFWHSVFLRFGTLDLALGPSPDNEYEKRWIEKEIKEGEMEKNYSPSDSFSPESGGRVKPKTAIDAIRTQGTIRLKK